MKALKVITPVIKLTVKRRHYKQFVAFVRIRVQINRYITKEISFLGKWFILKFCTLEICNHFKRKCESTFLGAFTFLSNTS